ncbi:MAG: hypothetical protein K2Q12_03000 [Rickettsiales bacterium]|nr:hypothetical protein [Rickettsiales bacterium]
MVTRIPTDAAMQELLAANGIIPANDGERMGNNNRVTPDGRVNGADTATARELEARRRAALERLLSGSSTGADNNYQHPTQIQCEQNPAACFVTPPTATPGHGAVGGSNTQNVVGVIRGR